MEQKSSHTPGPWGIEDRDQLDAHYRVRTELAPWDNGTRVINTVAFVPGTDDARLIAAAPDLLAALRELVDLKDLRLRIETLERVDVVAPGLLQMESDYRARKSIAWDGARAAVAKATGVAP